MTLHFIRQLVIHTICNVTGAPPKEVTALDRVELNTRDWEQVFSRLEATLDIQTGMLTSVERSFSIDALMRVLHARLTDNIVT
jgi:CBS-domain-containing membrane protein